MMGRAGSAREATVDVVVLNHDIDVLDAMAVAIESAGFTVAARLAHGLVDEIAAFVRAHDPRVVVYDLGPPPVDRAVEKWRELCPQLGARRACVLTTTYDGELRLDPGVRSVECVLQKPVGFEDLASAVQRAMSRV